MNSISYICFCKIVSMRSQYPIPVFVYQLMHLHALFAARSTLILKMQWDLEGSFKTGTSPGKAKRSMQRMRIHVIIIYKLIIKF